MKKYLLLIGLAFFVKSISAQQTKPPFWNDIQAFKKQDSASFPGTGKILFVGSSSFTNWKDVQSYFPAYPIVNRGFGGSSLPDVIRYQEDVIFRYQPKQIVMYCGENDFAANDTVSVPTVVARFKQLFSSIRARFKDIPFAYVAMKPSPSRERLMPKYEAANKIIEDYLKGFKQTAFINIYHAMLKPDGKPIDEIFVGDKLHMNAKGYVIWQKIIEPYLLK